MAELTDAERRWIAALKRLAKRCPPTRGLWAGTGDLSVIALTEDGSMQHQTDRPYADGEVLYAFDCVEIQAGGGDPEWGDIDDLERPWLS
jgi:hypothetical protein